MVVLFCCFNVGNRMGIVLWFLCNVSILVVLICILGELCLSKFFIKDIFEFFGNFFSVFNVFFWIFVFFLEIKMEKSGSVFVCCMDKMIFWMFFVNVLFLLVNRGLKKVIICFLFFFLYVLIILFLVVVLLLCNMWCFIVMVFLWEVFVNMGINFWLKFFWGFIIFSVSVLIYSLLCVRINILIVILCIGYWGFFNVLIVRGFVVCGLYVVNVFSVSVWIWWLLDCMVCLIIIESCFLVFLFSLVCFLLGIKNNKIIIKDV